MIISAEQLPAPTAAAFILRVGTALLMTFAATLVLVHAEIYLSHPLMTDDVMGGLF